MKVSKKQVEEIKEKARSGKISSNELEEILNNFDFSEKEYKELVEEFIKEEITPDKEEKLEEEIIEVAENESEEEIANEAYFSYDIIKQYFKDISRYDVLTKEEELIQIKKAKSGDEEAEELLVTSNLRLVAKIALRYIRPGVLFLDLVQDGTIGLMKAIKRFEPAKGYKLSTYATWWIKKEIVDSLKEEINFIKIPNYIFLSYQKVIAAERKLTQEKGKKVSNEEIAESLKMEIEEIEKIKNIVENKMLTLNVSDGEGKDVEIDIEDNTTEEEIEKHMEKENKTKKISKMLKSLNARESKIIEMYFGLSEDGRRYTFKEIGEVLSLSSERVRILKKRALRKLRYVGKRLRDE